MTLADPVTAAGTALFSHELEPRDEFARYKLAISVLDAGGNEVARSDELIIRSVP